MRRRSVGKNVRKSVRRNLKKSSKRNVRKSVRRNVRKSVRRNVRKSVRRNVRKGGRMWSRWRRRQGGPEQSQSAYKYNPGTTIVPIDMIDRCLSNLNLTGPDNFSTGDTPGVQHTIRRKQGFWPWRRGGSRGTGFMDINTNPNPDEIPNPVERPNPVETPERIIRGNKKEGVEIAILQIHKLIDKAKEENKQFIDTIELKRVLPKIRQVNNFFDCLRSSQTSVS